MVRVVTNSVPHSEIVDERVASRRTSTVGALREVLRLQAALELLGFLTTADRQLTRRSRKYHVKGPALRLPQHGGQYAFLAAALEGSVLEQLALAELFAR